LDLVSLPFKMDLVALPPFVPFASSSLPFLFSSLFCAWALEVSHSREI
jgi:hypothetical protein